MIGDKGQIRTDESMDLQSTPLSHSGTLPLKFLYQKKEGMMNDNYLPLFLYIRRLRAAYAYPRGLTTGSNTLVISLRVAIGMSPLSTMNLYFTGLMAFFFLHQTLRLIRTEVSL